jgi:hypothetical protein
MTNLLFDFEREEPAATLTRPQQALWWLGKGRLQMGAEWQKAHELCQQQEGEIRHDLVHALAHWIEGDKANAAYWYRRAGGAPASTIEAEWRRLVELFSP